MLFDVLVTVRFCQCTKIEILSVYKVHEESHSGYILSLFLYLQMFVFLFLSVYFFIFYMLFITYLCVHCKGIDFKQISMGSGVSDHPNLMT